MACRHFSARILSVFGPDIPFAYLNLVSCGSCFPSPQGHWLRCTGDFDTQYIFVTVPTTVDREDNSPCALIIRLAVPVDLSMAMGG